MSNTSGTNGHNPLLSLDEWEEYVLQRYPDPESIAKNKQVDEFRNYEAESRDTVKNSIVLITLFRPMILCRKKEQII